MIAVQTRSETYLYIFFLTFWFKPLSVGFQLYKNVILLFPSEFNFTLIMSVSVQRSTEDNILSLTGKAGHCFPGGGKTLKICLSDSTTSDIQVSDSVLVWLV